jgi:hypothetical protein
MPPQASKHHVLHSLDIHQVDHLDENELRAWSEQASNLPGERM